MVNPSNVELVARCVPLETQHTTIWQNSATINATISLKTLAGAVLERNKQSNSRAIDTQKPPQLLTEKNCDKVALELRGILAESDKQKIQAWLAQIGETNQELIEDVLAQVTNDAGALAYFLKRAEEAREVMIPIALVQCGNCQHFNSYNDHGIGGGICKAGVQFTGLYQWSETQHTCDKHHLITR